MNIQPGLTLGSVDPKKGNQNTQFMFTVTYTDQNNDTPSYINVVINGTVYAMAKQEISDNDYTDGCIYQYTTTLAPSAHNYTYYFECSDGYLTDMTGTYDDLEVYLYIAPNGGDDDGGGKKAPAAPDFTIPLIIVGISVIAAAGVVIFIMKKRQHRIIE